jgi:hypothetical protein
MSPSYNNAPTPSSVGLKANDGHVLERLEVSHELRC